MKVAFVVIITLSTFSKVFAQSSITRHFHSKKIGDDSVNVYFNQFYELVEDSCARIVRYSRYDFKNRHFIGKFKDVDKQNADFTIAEGSYTSDGKKNGEFILHALNGNLVARGLFKDDLYEGDWMFYYPDGKLKAKGAFKDGKYYGDWDFFYDDGNPKHHLRIMDSEWMIIDVWDTDGKIIVKNGSGSFTIDCNGINWTGKLLNGEPDGTWSFRFSPEVYGSEKFKKGKFIRGFNNNYFGAKTYNDKSRFSFLPALPDLFVTQAEHFPYYCQRIGCNGIDYSNYHDILYKIFD